MPLCWSISLAAPPRTRDRNVSSRLDSSAGLDATTAARRRSGRNVSDKRVARSVSSLRERRCAYASRRSIWFSSSATSCAEKRNSSASCADVSRARSREVRDCRRSSFGASSVRCVLMPPKPMALTLARSLAPAGINSPRFSVRSADASPFNSSCGSSPPTAGGRICAPSAIVALIKPATPAAALVCPMIALTELTMAFEPSVSTLVSRRARASACSSAASPTAVPVPWPSKYATVSAP